jgi:hypothetical protein
MSIEDITGSAARPPNLPLRADQLIGMARGFAWLCIGLLVTFMLLLGFLEWHLPQVGILLPPSLAGAGLSLFGGILWWRSAEQQRPWRRYARLATFLGAMQIYLAPFPLWWRHDLGNLHLFLNSMALLTCLPGLAWIVARQAEVTGRILGDHGLATEARFGRRALIVPVLLITLLLMAYETAIAAGAPLPEPPSIALPGLILPPWLAMAHLGAVLMTLSIGWRCTHACHLALAQTAKQPLANS